jgi:hypothetical protein
MFTPGTDTAGFNRKQGGKAEMALGLLLKMMVSGLQWVAVCVTLQNLVPRKEIFWSVDSNEGGPRSLEW